MPVKKEKGQEPIKGARMSKKDKLRQQALKD
jgi:ATP-dependent RNA helicase RhlE